VPIVCSAVGKVDSVQAGIKEDRRKDERVRYSAHVEVSWQDQEGRSRHAKAQLVDVSAGGLSFLSNEKIAVNTPIRVHYSNGDLDGQTRYWTCDILGWVVGVQLDQRVEWGPLAVEAASHANPEWPVGLVRPRKRIATIVRGFLRRLGRQGPKAPVKPV
jgi:hypothetical protein